MPNAERALESHSRASFRCHAGCLWRSSPAPTLVNRVVLGIAAVIAYWLSGCAHVEPPPGGPIDKIPPYVTGIYPSPHQTDVPRDAAVLFQFSEWVKADGMQSQLALSPTLPGKVRLESNGKEWTLRHDSLFRENTTYRLVVPGQLKDMHDVAMDSAFELVFSTGKVIDSGVIEGQLFQIPPVKLKSTWAALFSEDRSHLVARRGEKRKSNWPDSTINAWREKPAYLTAVDTGGRFRFNALPPGRYGVLGFSDLNQNQLPDNAEPMALGPAGVLVGAVTPPSLFLRMAAQDTQALRLSKVTWIPAGDSVDGWIGGAVKVGFNHSPAWTEKKMLASFSLGLADAKNSNRAFRAQPEAIAMTPDGDFELWFPKVPVKERILLTVSQLTDELGNPLDTAHAHMPFESLPKVKGKNEPTQWTLWVTDLLSPKPQAFPKEARAPFSSVLVRSESPISDSVLAGLNENCVLKCDSTKVVVKSQREGAFGIRLSWALPKGFRNPFTLSLNSRKLLAPAVDSIKVKVNPESESNPTEPVELRLGKWTSLDSASWSRLVLKVGSRWLGWTGILRHENTGESRQIRLNTDKGIRLDSLTPGVWRLSVYADQNGNGIWNAGRTHPWQPQEPTSLWPDTLVLEPGKELGPIEVGPNPLP